MAHAHDGVAAGAALAAPDFALRLQALLGQHSELAADLMRGRIRGDEDFAQAANSALNRNTDAIAQLIGSSFGTPAATRFREQWTAHVTALFNYARGLADHDGAVSEEARTALGTFERNLAAFFADASQGRLNHDAAQAAVLAHVTHLLHQADAYAAHDYGEADRAYRDGYRHASELGRVVAAALVAPDAAAALQAPTWRLKSQLGQFLAEHVVQIVDATRAGLTNGPDFAAAGDAVNGNTRDLAAVVDSLFGHPAATAFQSLWADHIDQLMAYTGGVVAHDAQRRDAAVAGLGTFEHRFADFLDNATQHRLDSATLAKALVAHDGMLLQHTDAFAAKNYQKAHDIADSTYEQMYELAGKLADAFGATVAARLPSGGPETGLGGMAGTVGGR